MSKYICLRCGAVFDDDEIATAIIDRHPYGEGTAPEYGSVCPECHSAEISPAVECVGCGNYIPEDEAECHPITEEIICHDCYENSMAMAEALRDEIREPIWER